MIYSDFISLTVKRLIKKLNNLGRVNQLVILSTLAVLWQVQKHWSSSWECCWESTSIRHDQELNLSRSSLQRILTKDLHLHAYKFNWLKNWNLLNRVRWMNYGTIIVNADFLNKIIFSDETHFHLDKLINQ